MIVAIDGPGGTGKSTVSKLVAVRLGVPHLDTGAFYRAATVAVLRSGVDLADGTDVARVVQRHTYTQENGRMFLDDEDVSVEIRSDPVTLAVSQVAANPSVRERLVETQRAWVRRHDNRGVVEGRDIGSVVFPGASYKVYLDASPDVRAARRALQDGDDAEEVLADLARRDHLDSTRTASPLTVPGDAIVVDTSDLTIDEVVDRVVALIDE
jgi:cytidylate kinase